MHRAQRVETFRVDKYRLDFSEKPSRFDTRLISGFRNLSLPAGLTPKWRKPPVFARLPSLRSGRRGKRGLEPRLCPRTVCPPLASPNTGLGRALGRSALLSVGSWQLRLRVTCANRNNELHTRGNKTCFVGEASSSFNWRHLR